jgi:predicted nucleic acid-binding protein
MTYADTSFLVSVYGADVNSASAREFIGDHQPRLPFTFLHWPELAGAIWKRQPNAEEIWESIKADLDDSKKIYAPDLDADRIGQRAAGLIKNYGRQWGKLRALDSLHVAAAVEGGFRTFLSFDANSYQRVLAHDQKLSVWPPLTPDEKKRLKQIP